MWMCNPYSKKICSPVFISKRAGDVFAGAAAHLRVSGRLVHLVLHRKRLSVKDSGAMLMVNKTLKCVKT